MFGLLLQGLFGEIALERVFQRNQRRQSVGMLRGVFNILHHLLGNGQEGV